MRSIDNVGGYVLVCFFILNNTQQLKNLGRMCMLFMFMFSFVFKLSMCSCAGK